MMNFKIRLFVGFFVIFNFTISSAQKEEVKGVYSITNEAGLFDFVSGKFNFLDLNMSGYHFNMGLDIGADFMYNKVRGGFTYSRSYWNRINNWITGESSHNSIYEDGPSNSFRADLGFVFSKKERKEDVRIDLKHEGNTTYYTNIESFVGYNWSVDLGVEKGVTYYYFGDNSSVSGKNINTGKTDKIGSSPGSSSTVTVGSYSENITEGVSSYLAYTTFSIGVSRTRMYDLECNFSDYGSKKASFSSRMYGAILINTGSFENIYYEYATVDASSPYSTNWTLGYTEYQLDGYTKIFPIGLKVGSEMFSTDGFGFSSGIEGGLFPGAAGSITNNLFLNLKFGMILGKRLG